MILCVSVVCYDFSIFISNFVDLTFLPFFFFLMNEETSLKRISDLSTVRHLKETESTHR